LTEIVDDQQIERMKEEEIVSVINISSELEQSEEEK
jgi:hypothetical protein